MLTKTVTCSSVRLVGATFDTAAITSLIGVFNVTSAGVVGTGAGLGVGLGSGFGVGVGTTVGVGSGTDGLGTGVGVGDG